MRFKKNTPMSHADGAAAHCFGCSNDTLPEELTMEGRHLEIVLKENPSTGYSWTMDDFDTTVY